MTIKDGGPAFPIGGHLQPNGMSLRDWFAGQFAAAMLSDFRTIEAAAETAKKHSQSPGKTVTEEAYQYADAMLAQREEGGE